MSPQQVAEGKKRTEELRAQIVTRSQERKAVRSSVPRPTPTAEAIRKSPQQVPASQPMPQPAVSAHKGRATVELTGVIGLGTPRAFLEITDQGGSGSIKKVTVKAGDRVDSIEIVQIDVKTGQVTIRNAGAESVLSFKGR